MNKKWSFNKVASYLILAMALGTLAAGCGGGGADTGTVNGGVLSYLADQQGGNFVSRWWYAASGASSVAMADEKTASSSGTSQYTVTMTHQILSRGTNGAALISGSWGTNLNPDVYYDWISSGWVQSPNTAKLVDNGDGRNVTITPTGEAAIVAAVAKTNLANTSIVCTPSCVVPGVYPAGAASYQLTVSYTSSQFTLYGPTIAKPITDQSGHVLATLPALNTTFCDPALSYVFQATGTGGLYNVFSTASCAAGDITIALGAASLGTVTMNNQLTGTVLHVQSTNGATLSGLVNMIYGAQAGAVGYGWMFPVGTYQLDIEFNKAAINAQLLANGLVVLP